ncbi:MAG: hypothetical protein WC845_00075 [Candidatus Staskawiczbacteria bacterium]|jgi:hypothetical protein
MNKSNKGISTPLAIGIIAVIALSGGGVAYYYITKQPSPVACTAEAKVCPDGSAVGRVGPNCEFAACPNEIAGNQYFSIPELNIKFKMNDKIKDLVYAVSDGTRYGYPYKKAILSTESLIGASKGACELNVPGESALGEVIVSEKSPSELGVMGEQSLYESNNFYISYSGPQSICVDGSDEAALNLFTEQLGTLNEFLKTVEPIDINNNTEIFK